MANAVQSTKRNARAGATVLAVASAGGHWDELMEVREAFAGHRVHYATTMKGFAERSGLSAHIIPDCNRDQRWQAFRSLIALAVLIVRLRPQAIVTTGALPGFFALMIGRKFGARTMWIDSIANAGEMSLAGQRARRYADVWLSQWPGVADSVGATFLGSVL